jgi:hypothetical protein
MVTHWSAYGWACATAGLGRSRKSFAARRLARIIDTQFVFVQVDHWLYRSARDDPLLAVRWRIADLPKPLNKVSKRENRSAGTVVHGRSKSSRGLRMLQPSPEVNGGPVPKEPRTWEKSSAKRKLWSAQVLKESRSRVIE